MAGWKKVLTNSEVGFQVDYVAPDECDETGRYVFVSTTNGEDVVVYRRVANKNKKDGTFVTTIDGCDVVFDSNYKVISVTRVYDTAGLKKAVNVGGANKQHKVKAKTPKAKVPKTKTETEEDVRHEQYDTIETCLKCNIPVYLAGPAGSGKNYTLEQIAKQNGWNFYFSNSVQQEYKLTGFIDAGGKYHETEFYKACTDKNECVFFLDEMDASIPEVLVLLNAAIANGYFEFPNGKVNLEHVHFVAAGNTVGTGADEMYTGRMVLDQATLDRFVIIEFGYSENVELHLAKGNKELVDFVHDLRKQAEINGIRATFSYRCISMVTKLESANMDIVAILKIAVFKGLDKDTINTFSMDPFNKYGKGLQELKVA